MRNKKFYFIVFEGIEGTGKSHQINKLYNKLKAFKFDVIRTREPGGPESAEKIRKLIFSKNSNPFDKPCEYISVCTPAFSIDLVHRENAN